MLGALLDDANRAKMQMQALDKTPGNAVDAEMAAPRPLSNKHGAPGEPRRWFILRCGSGLEFLAEKKLRESGWDIFLPREKKWQPSLWRRRPREAEAEYPRFPGYLFIEIAPPRWPDLETWPFSSLVRGILGMGGMPVPLAWGEIERLRAEDGAPVPHIGSAPLHRALVVGDCVRVRVGAFMGFEARVDRIDDAGARITVQLFGRPAPVRLPLTWLEAA